MSEVVFSTLPGNLLFSYDGNTLIINENYREGVVLGGHDGSNREIHAKMQSEKMPKRNNNKLHLRIIRMGKMVEGKVLG